MTRHKHVWVWCEQIVRAGEKPVPDWPNESYNARCAACGKTVWAHGRRNVR